MTGRKAKLYKGFYTLIFVVVVVFGPNPVIWGTTGVDIFCTNAAQKYGV